MSISLKWHEVLGQEPGLTYSSGDNRVQVFRVPVAEGHKIGVESSDAL